MKKVSLLILSLALATNLGIEKTFASIDGGVNPNVRMISAPKAEKRIKRIDFINSIFEICKMNVSDEQFDSIFADINVNSKNYSEIAYAGKAKLAHGYPDLAFKPDGYIKNDEAISVMANIIQKNYFNFDVLRQYKDYESIPEWALYSYVKAKNAGFIKDTEYLNPEGYLTEEDASFLLSQVDNYVVSNYKEEKMYEPLRGSLTFLREEKLNVSKEAPVNTVSFYEECTVVNAGNLLPVSFIRNFNSLKSNVGEVVEFIADEDLVTVEGTTIYPRGTKFIGVVVKKKLTTWLDRPTKALIDIYQIDIPTDDYVEYYARTYTKNNKVYLTKFDKNVSSKGKAISNADFLVKYSQLVSPIVRYDNKAKDRIYLLLTGDMVIKTPEQLEMLKQFEL